MSEAQILIKNGTKLYEFTLSPTGQLDYTGPYEKDADPDLAEYQKIASSTYFTPAHYTYLDDSENFNPEIYVSPKTNVSNPTVYEYLLHAGALIAAVEAKDSYLAGTLYMRRRETFDKFSMLTQYIMKPICAQIIFSMCYGTKYTLSPKQVPFLLESVTETIKYDCTKDEFEKALMRYFKENKVTLTLPVVGTDYHDWCSCSQILDDIASNIECTDILSHVEKVRKARHDFYASLETAVQAEPYNPADKNAIGVMIESIDSKISGNTGLIKAGYLRATAAQLIREAKPTQMCYKSKLMSFNSEYIVVQITI